MKLHLIFLLAVFRGIVVFGQTPPDSRSMTFETASVKPVIWHSQRPIRIEDNAHFELRPAAMSALIKLAYGVRTEQLSGPEWIKQTYFDVVATMPKNATTADIPTMLQQLLKTRFHLIAHREFRPTPAYAITIGKEGPKLTPCEIKEEAPPLTVEERLGGVHALAPGECPVNRVHTRDDTSMVVEANTLAFLANALRDGSDRPVVDRTGLTGNFAIGFECLQAKGVEGDPSGLPTLTAALRKLGLNLDARREDLEYLVIDGLDKIPTSN